MPVIISEIKEAIRYYRRIPNFRKVVHAVERGEETLPVSVQVQTVSACDSACVFCPYPYVSKTVSQGVMEWETYKKIVDECAAFPDLKIFTPVLQNEPLIDKNIHRAIAYFKEKNGGRTPVQMSTNGYLLNDENIKNLSASGLDYIAVSLNAINKETYEKLLPGFKFEKIMDNIEKLISSNHGEMRVIIRFLVTNKNKDEVKEAVSYWHKRKVMTEVIDLLHNRAGSVEIKRLKAERPVKRIRRFLNRFWFNIFTDCCVIPFRQMYILYNGDVLLCGNDWKREVILGNVNKNTLREIWNGPEAVRMRKLILEKRYDRILPCSGCSMPDNYDSWR